MQISVNESELVGKMYEAARQFDYFLHQSNFDQLDDDDTIKRFAAQNCNFVFWAEHKIKGWKWNRFIIESNFKANYKIYITQIINSYHTTNENLQFLYRTWYERAVELRRVPDSDVDKYPYYKH